MSQVFDSVPSAYTNTILCYYNNSTTQLQTLRVTNIPGWYFERIVFPGERLLFEAVSEAQLEIYPGCRVIQNLARLIPCWQLAIQESEPAKSKTAVCSA
ncbi:MAG: DUF1830 domain-containing protein [Limnospira sp.]